MLERKDVDIVAVCTPHNAHTQYVVAAAEAGKHIIIEKPVALTPEDVLKQLRAVQKENAQLRKLVADQALDISILKVAAEGNF